ncbi:KTSC domain-containing protein [Novosphingobium sp. JCM 18896]|uniref:KTSC domain-containing protein n=1 Tax=Novosphingobium sp. JCM 18896 TaxID=2989731 RepID=UPI0022224DB5|nr:KTSC domain-containing protein [Novosphingobium sp. JCM 18896]MCW1432496.1 KTSC domain-containing protein [Novosphingobium sp. JCM 18896]
MSNHEHRGTASIERVGYDPGTRALTVWFRGSRRYDFSDVPPEVYEQLCGGDEQDLPRCDRAGAAAFPRLGRHRH